MQFLFTFVWSIREECHSNHFTKEHESLNDISNVTFKTNLLFLKFRSKTQQQQTYKTQTSTYEFTVEVQHSSISYV